MDWLTITIAACVALAGATAVIAAIFEWDGFMKVAQVRGATHLFGREGARLAYIILGVVTIVLAMLLTRV